MGVMVGKGEDRRRLAVEDLKTLREWGSVLDGHPNPMEGVPFFDAATGSLGQGLSWRRALPRRPAWTDTTAASTASSATARPARVRSPRRWTIVDHKLTNVLTDLQLQRLWPGGPRLGPAGRRAAGGQAQGVRVQVKTIDGHNPGADQGRVRPFIEISGDEQAKPMAVVAKTVKGWGCPVVQGGGWHGKPAAVMSLKKAIAELDERGSS
jgi:transketolase